MSIFSNLKLIVFYKGSTDDVQRRFKEYDAGKVISTKRYRPWKLRWFTEKSDRKSALKMEWKLKNITPVKRLEDFLSRHS